MTKFFVSPLKISAAIEPLVLEKGEKIVVDGYTYVELMRKPRGRNILRKLKSMDGEDQFIIYS